MVNNGVGVGSIVPVRTFQYLGDDRGYGYKPTLRYITGFEWEGCHWGNSELKAIHRDIKDIVKPGVYGDSTTIVGLLRQSREYIDSGEVPADLMSATNTYNMPKGWLDFEDEKTVEFAYKQFFTTKKGYEKRRTQFRFPNEQARDIIIKLDLTDQYPNMISS